MQIEMLMNGSAKLLLSPENEVEEAFLAALCKQQNDIIEVRQQMFVLNKTFNKGMLIAKKSLGTVDPSSPTAETLEDK
jgi:hypothetical protein